MSEFLTGIKHGFTHGMFNNMFGGFASFNNRCCWNPTSLFMAPNLNFMGFYKYPDITGMTTFNFNTPVGNSIFNNGFSFNFNNNFFQMPNMFNFNFGLGYGGSDSADKKTNVYSDEDTSYFSYDSKNLKEKWKSKKPNLSDAFYNKVVAISKRIECDPNDLMGLMNAESGIKTTAVNGTSGATGLIQFMPSTAKDLGTSVGALKSMSPEEQLKYVEKYLQSRKREAGINGKVGAGTLYALVFLPGYANRDVLCSKGDRYYNANTGLDLDGDKKITKADLAKQVNKFKA